MGVKDLWSILTPYAERKPICELRGKTVAIDLAGWVCESLNVVDYFVHPRHHLKNLFFRTCYLIWEDITPIFVLEGSAPKLKSQVMEKRNEVQFRGVRPKEKPSDSQSEPNKAQTVKGDKGRSRFNQVLKQCENLLLSMGIQCIKGPGEAEAYCAFLNHKGLVDGVISQDSDCFAYGAICVYRNFSVSTQGALAAQGGAVDIYDMRKITSKMDFGQNKVIVMALLCGCDYCPDGVGGVGRDSVVKLFNKYKNDEILIRIRSWRLEDDKYTAVEMKVDDKSICTNCGHFGRTQSHTKKGCGICRTNQGCDESLWKEERLSLKAELVLRKKAMADPKFPSEEIIDEFQSMPKEVPKLDLSWRQPNMVKFIKQVGHLLQWTEIYCFQKFFPILTRWMVLNAPRLRQMSGAVAFVTPKEIVKKRIVKGSPCVEILWHDSKGFFNGLIPDEQMLDLVQNNPKGQQDLWSTVEPMKVIELSYPELLEAFIKSKEKPKKQPKRQTKTKLKENPPPLGVIENLNDLAKVPNQVAKTLKPRKPAKVKSTMKGMQMIDKFLKHKIDDKLQNTPRGKMEIPQREHCSTPLTKEVPSDLESDDECGVLDMSDIVNAIVKKSHVADCLTSHRGKRLVYETMKQDISLLINQLNASSLEDESNSNLKDQDEHEKTTSPELNYSISALNTSKCLDDIDILTEKRILSNSFRKSTYKEAKRMSLDDSFDVLVKMGSGKLSKYSELTVSNENMSKPIGKPVSIVDRFKEKHKIGNNSNHFATDDCEDANGVSYFFNSSFQQENEDTFEKLMETSMAKYDIPRQSDESDEEDIIELSD